MIVEVAYKYYSIENKVYLCKPLEFNVCMGMIFYVMVMISICSTNEVILFYSHKVKPSLRSYILKNF